MSGQCGITSNVFAKSLCIDEFWIQDWNNLPLAHFEEAVEDEDMSFWRLVVTILLVTLSTPWQLVLKLRLLLWSIFSGIALVMRIEKHLYGNLCSPPCFGPEGFCKLSGMPVFNFSSTILI
jgi:hypothetical protein